MTLFECIPFLELGQHIRNNKYCESSYIYIKKVNGKFQLCIHLPNGGTKSYHPNYDAITRKDWSIIE
jgi:hypothetical protein